MMPKTIEQLEQTACLYWPTNLSNIVAEISSIPILVKTQNQFLNILIQTEYKNHPKAVSRNGEKMVNSTTVL